MDFGAGDMASFCGAADRVVMGESLAGHAIARSAGRTLIEIYEQQIEETRRMNAILERMAVALEKRAASPRD
jgi:ATP-dependent protease HslVU (ClpYQ) peptidase subunit